MNTAAAYVYGRQDSPYWWIKYWCPRKLDWKRKSSGHRRDDSVGYKRALADARKLEAAAIGSRQSAAATRWSAWVEQWLREKHRNSPKSLSSELGRWHWLDAFLTEHNLHGPEGVTYVHATEYMGWRTSQVKRVSKKHPSHNTALMEVRLLSRILTEAVHRGFVFANPLQSLGIRRDPAPEKPELADGEIAEIRRALAEREGHLPLKDRWMTVCFEIALCQGCRLSETSVPLTDIDENAGRILFHAKRRKVFTTRLHPDLVPLIRVLRSAGAEITCTLPKMVTKEWHWFFKGRPERGWKGICPRACFHCTRVTAITRMARAGVPIQQAMAYVGHADHTVHRIYQRLQAQDLNRCVEALRFAPSILTPQNPGAAAPTPGAIAAS